MGAPFRTNENKNSIANRRLREARMGKKDKALSGKINKKADALDLLLAETDSLVWAAEEAINELEDRTVRRDAREGARRAAFGRGRKA